MKYLNFPELIMLLLYLGLVFIFALVVYVNIPRSKSYRRYFLPGLFLKLLGAIVVGAIYAFYYGGGDTLTYFSSAKEFNEVLFNDPVAYLRMLFTQAEGLDQIIPGFTENNRYFSSDSTWLVIKISAVLGLFTLNTYFATAILYTVLSYAGVWVLFRVLTRLYPKLEKEMAISVLFVPSVFFWGSGLLKDPLCLAAIGFLMLGVHSLLFRKKRWIRSLLLIYASAYVLLMVKIYILLALAPALILWGMLRIRSRLPNKALRQLFLPVFLAIGVYASLGLFERFTQDIRDLALENIIETALVKQQYNAVKAMEEGAGSSSYDLGEIEPTLMGLLKSAPYIINIPLFRPYIWEVHKVVQLLSALESFVLLALSLWLLWKTRLFGFFKRIFADPNLIVFITFTLILAFAIGLSSGNFGNVVRYKVPFLPFFVATLLVLRAQVKDRK